jgi:hypothetical protein
MPYPNDPNFEASVHNPEDDERVSPIADQASLMTKFIQRLTVPGEKPPESAV